MDFDFNPDDGRGDEYFDIDAILAEQQKMACFFKSDIPHFGFLSGSKSDTLSRSTRVEIPFWMVEKLASSGLADIELPRCFGVKARNDLQASPTAVDLNLLCPYFYAFGVNVYNLIVDRALHNVLTQTFVARMQMVMDYTQSAVLGGAASSASADQENRFLRTLDEEEKELHRIGIQSARAESSTLKASEILTRSGRAGR